MQNISSNCKLKSKYWTPSIESCKKFWISIRKNALWCFEFICEVLEVIAECSKMRIWIFKEFRVSIRVYAVERLKALALDSKLIQIVLKSQPWISELIKLESEWVFAKLLIFAIVSMLYLV